MDDGFKDYIIDYNYDGDKWSLSMPARSREDALARLAALSRTSTVFGYTVGSEKSSGHVPASAT